MPAHKGARIEQLIDSARAELRYLPPYSQDMNPIEKAFSKLTATLRKLAEQTVAGLMRALDIFESAECTNFLRACGYGWWRSGLLAPKRSWFSLPCATV